MKDSFELKYFSGSIIDDYYLLPAGIRMATDGDTVTLVLALEVLVLVLLFRWYVRHRAVLCGLSRNGSSSRRLPTTLDFHNIIRHVAADVQAECQSATELPDDKETPPPFESHRSVVVNIRDFAIIQQDSGNIVHGTGKWEPHVLCLQFFQSTAPTADNDNTPTTTGWQLQGTRRSGGTQKIASLYTISHGMWCPTTGRAYWVETQGNHDILVVGTWSRRFDNGISSSSFEGEWLDSYGNRGLYRCTPKENEGGSVCETDKGCTSSCVAQDKESSYPVDATTPSSSLGDNHDLENPPSWAGRTT